MIVVGAPLERRARAVQRGRGDPPRPGARRRAQELPARVPRVLREAPVPRRARARSATRSSCSDDDVPFGTDLLFAVHATCPSLTRARRDLRGPVGADPAEHLRRAGRRDRAGQPVGQQHHRSARPTTGAQLCASQSARTISGLRLHRRRAAASRPPTWPGTARRIDLRERRPARRGRALLRRRAADPGRRRPRPDRRRPRRAPAASATRSTTTASGCGVCAGSSSSSASPRRAVHAAPHAASASRSCPPTRPSRNERCEEVYNIQVRGLETRLRATGIEKVVIGVSGGLDSTHALIVAARALDRLGLPRTNVLGVHDAGLRHQRADAATTPDALMQALGVSGARDRHPPGGDADARATSATRRPTGEPVYDVTYENVQAGERTSHLFRLANHHGALVLGTGDLSELALGWSHLRRRRPDVALQRQRLGAQDADPVPDPLGDRHRPVRRRRRRGARARCSAPRSRPS